MEATAQQKDGWQVPEQSEIIYTHDDGIKVICEQGSNKAGPIVLIEGTKGSIAVSRGKIESTPAEIIGAKPSQGQRRPPHRQQEPPQEVRLHREPC